MITIKNYKKLLQTLLNNGFVEEDCNEGCLRELWASELQLNRYRLEIAAQKQSVLFEKYNSLAEDLSGLLEDEVRLLRKLRSNKDLQIRSCSKHKLKSKYGVTDLKEAAIKSLIDLDVGVVQQEKKIGFLRSFFLKVKGVVKAAEHRRGNIRILTDLYVNNYYNCSEGRGKYYEKRKRRK